MPRVTLEFANGRSETHTGGCFGFTGRSGDCRRSFSNAGEEITKYIFDLGYQIRNLNNCARASVKMAHEMFKYLATESPYAKYVHRLIEGDANSFNRWAVEIKTDIPGHMVIGTATVFRFVCYMAGENVNCFKVFSKAVELGSNKTIAFMLACMVFRNRSSLGGPSGGTMAQRLTRYPDLGDDTPLDFSTMTKADLASYIKGDWEFLQNDTRPYPNYSNTGRYSEQILNSYRTGNFDFVDYIKCRFLPSQSYIAPQRASGGGGLGRSTSNSLTVVTQNCIEPLALVGAALLLTAEYKKYGSFANVNLHHGV